MRNEILLTIKEFKKGILHSFVNIYMMKHCDSVYKSVFKRDPTNIPMFFFSKYHAFLCFSLGSNEHAAPAGGIPNSPLTIYFVYILKSFIYKTVRGYCSSLDATAEKKSSLYRLYNESHRIL